jgi:hypothetical protein
MQTVSHILAKQLNTEKFTLQKEGKHYILNMKIYSVP